ncbi:MAG: glycosyltransferase family 2 protein [Candidatus Fimivivens sp.]|nr:glycosyltransferase family 2 protein [Candidatus Fimivivens sp.]
MNNGVLFLIKALFEKTLKSVRENGIKMTVYKIKNWIKKFLPQKRLKRKFNITQQQRTAEQGYKFERDIKISILVPLYNTPLKLLKEMVASVINQTYPNWELCMADGSDLEHNYVGEYCQQLMQADSRIIYKKLDSNRGISENTNVCIDISTGEYLGLFDHDDLLHPSALFEIIKAICEKNADFIYTDEDKFTRNPNNSFDPNFKPDFSIDTLRSYNYICHFTVFSRKLMDRVGRFRSTFDGSQDYDMILRLTEIAETIIHIPKILYYWRFHTTSVAYDISAKPYTLKAAKEALAEHLQRCGIEGSVLDSKVPSTYRIEYKIENEPLVSIIIPNKDHIDDLKKCIDSVESLSEYKNKEIIIVENNSTETATFEYYNEITAVKRNIKVIYWDGVFNYSRINNFAVGHAQGKYLLFLNNDIEVITPRWIENMLMFCQRSDVGAAGAMLYYPDDTVQHAGVIVGLGSVAGHSHKYYRRGESGFMLRMTIAQNLSAVTAACMMVRRDVFQLVGGFDEEYAVAFNDVDLCMKIRKAGYLIVWTPYAELYHYESKSRGADDSPDKKKRFNSEVALFQSRWATELETGDPYYNPNLTLDKEDFSIR